jgi:hypothetical protein
MVVHPELLTIGMTPLLSLLAFCKIAFALGLISYAVISAGKSLHRLISIILGMALLLAS